MSGISRCDWQRISWFDCGRRGSSVADSRLFGLRNLTASGVVVCRISGYILMVQLAIHRTVAQVW